MTLRPKHWTIAFAVPLALGLAACTTPPENTPAGSTAEASSEAPDSASAESESEKSGSGDDELVTDNATTEAATVEVEAEGDGPIGLKSGAVPTADPQAVSGKLITGPGGCFALVDDDQPRLLIFGDDAEFTLREGKPSVTTRALGTVTVGSRLSASATSVGMDETTGVPERCAHGAQDTVLVITGE